MTPALLARLRPHVTVWGEGNPDPAYADAVVLAALRALGRDGPAMGGGGSDVVVIAITADAAAPDNSRFARRAVVEITPTRNGRPWRVLEWASP